MCGESVLCNVRLEVIYSLVVFSDILHVIYTPSIPKRSPIIKGHSHIPHDSHMMKIMKSDVILIGEIHNM